MSQLTSKSIKIRKTSRKVISFEEFKNRLRLNDEIQAISILKDSHTHDRDVVLHGSKGNYEIYTNIYNLGFKWLRDGQKIIDMKFRFQQSRMDQLKNMFSDSITISAENITKVRLYIEEWV